MKNSELYSLRSVIDNLIQAGAGGAKFKYFLVKNRRVVESAIKDLDEAKKPAKEFEEFAEKAKALTNKHLEKDKDGNLVLYVEPGGKGGVIDVENGATMGYPKVSSPKKLRSEMDKLEAEYKDAIEAYNKVVSEFNETVLTEESDVSLYSVSISEVPDSVSVSDMSVLEPLIKPE